MLRRIHGLNAAIAEFSSRSTADPGDEPMTDGGGIYDEMLSPEAFADRVIADVRNHGDDFVRRITRALDRVDIEHFKVSSDVVRSAKGRLKPNEVVALELAGRTSCWFSEQGIA